MVKAAGNLEEAKRSIDLSRALLHCAHDYQNGSSVDFPKVLSISLHGRIPNLTNVYGFEAIHKLVTLLLGQFCASLNLIRPMNEVQIFECAEALVMTTEEDQLSIEDYVLFFKGAKEGKYGKILDRMDQQTIFQLLEHYRDDRHREYMRIKEARHLELKGMGPSERTEKNHLEEQLFNFTGRLAELRDKLKEQREINRMQKYSKDL